MSPAALLILAVFPAAFILSLAFIGFGLYRQSHPVRPPFRYRLRANRNLRRS